MAYQQVTPRGKEWIPLCTQQLRLRNLLQILATNLQLDQVPDEQQQERSPWPIQQGVSVHYTLHVTVMSPPFYTSEKMSDTPNPRWKEIEPGRFAQDVNTALPGVVVRIWATGDRPMGDRLVTMWGVFFSGLTYIGHSPPVNPKLYSTNTILFRMHGGYFTAVDCLAEPVEKARVIQASMDKGEVQPSYSVNLLSRLHMIQRAIRQQMQASKKLRDQIISRGFEDAPNSRRPLVTRRLMSPARAAQRGTIMKLKVEMEDVRFRVRLLQAEKEAKQYKMRRLLTQCEAAMECNQEKGSDLMGKFQDLHKEKEKLREWECAHLESQEVFLQTQAQLTLRQKQLISELNVIYPIAQLPSSLYTICDVHLPDSEDFMGHEEVMISVALGYVAHVSQMISHFLQIPLRYPVLHCGSRSRIIDHIIDKLPDKDREFPLYSKGKDKYQFKYAVYLLNKDVAQLRWYCGLPTRDLRTTLPNLAGLLQLYPGTATMLSEPTLPVFPRRLTSQPPGKFLPRIDHRDSGGGGSDPGRVSMDLAASERKGHRYSKSMDIRDLKLMELTPHVPPTGTSADTLANSASLSYSLDKGLDEFEAMTTSGGRIEGNGTACSGSEASLTVDGEQDSEVIEQEDEGHKTRQFLQEWHSETPLYYMEDELAHTEKVVHEEEVVVKEEPLEAKEAPADATEAPPGESQKEVPESTADSDADSSWANVASRTEALANRTRSFNLVRSRHNTLEDCKS